MRKLDAIIEEFEKLKIEEQESLMGGFITTTLENDKDKKDREDDDTNYFQCGCNNYCKRDDLGQQ